MVGKRVSHYRILHRHRTTVAEDVFMAEDVQTQRQVVLRFLPTSETAGREREKLERAVRVFSQASGTASGALHAVEKTDGHVFLVLDPPGADEFLTSLDDFARTLTDLLPAKAEGPSSVAVPSEFEKHPRSTGLADPTQMATLGVDSVEAPTTETGLGAGRILGKRYRILGSLGRGGMGEVWHAFDLKLQVEVALKALRRELFPDEASLEWIRREVRAGREVISPNVCRIYDLVVEEGMELLSMELVDGRTLTRFLQDRGPLEPQEASAIASQFLAGLEAIHEASMVHRDLKPENVMLTRTGRVVVMDFGIAQAISSQRTTEIAGTPAYMAPEVLHGDPPDLRSDLYAAGVVLTELIAPQGIPDREARERLLRDVRANPPRLPEGAWQRVLKRAVAPDPAERFGSARELALALEEATPRIPGAEDRNPYPGLSSFTDTDAGFFFGREAEIEELWKKLQRSRFLAVIGASGAGKTSFLQAGLIPTMPEGWGQIVCHPGTNPFISLAQALAKEFAGEPEAVADLLRFEDVDVALAVVKRWRQRYRDAIVFFDQFEELFTQCDAPVQSRFALLLRRLSLDADVRVVLSMRDDFLIQCREHDSLTPIFSDLTALGPLSGNALRRALVQPALACGYRFEDEELVEEMLDDVRGERGALPLLAFAISKLWEKRDHETGRLTRNAYTSLGRVSGALAQHAEAILEQIGKEDEGVVREIFRNLVTAKGTRSILSKEELFSVFDVAHQDRAGRVVQTLVDARLLTTYEMKAESETTKQYVEVVHESLFTSWPRLAHWRTQDAGSAQLRDQLRQAAQLWIERNRSEDLLWTGAAFREFTLWRERYPGGLTATEEAFAQAMLRNAERMRRRRRRIVTAAFAVLLAAMAAISTFAYRAWIQSRKTEAKRLLALAQIEEESSQPSLALAYAIASLELVDDPEARRFAMDLVWRGPTAMEFQHPTERRSAAVTVDFSPSGRRLATSHHDGSIEVWESAGRPLTVLRHEKSGYGGGYPRFGANEVRITGFWFPGTESFHVWSLTDTKPSCTVGVSGTSRVDLMPNRRQLVTISQEPGQRDSVVYRAWRLEAGEPRVLGARTVGGHGDLATGNSSNCLASIDPTGTWLAYVSNRVIEMVSVAGMDTQTAIPIGKHDLRVNGVAFHPDGKRIASVDAQGEVRIWSIETPEVPLRTFRPRKPALAFGVFFDQAGERLAVPRDTGAWIWAFDGLPGEDPIDLHGRGTQVQGASFHPSGNWIATAHTTHPTLWALNKHYPRVLRSEDGGPVRSPVFSANGKWLAALGPGTIQIWDLDGRTVRVLRPPYRTDYTWTLVADPQGRYLVQGDASGFRLIWIEDGHIQEIPQVQVSETAAVSPDGRYVAAKYSDYGGAFPDAPFLLYDVQRDSIRVLDNEPVSQLQFTPDGRLLVVRQGKLWEWNLEAGTGTPLLDNISQFALAPDGNSMLTMWRGRATYRNLETGVVRELTSHGDFVRAMALDTTARLAITGDITGATRVGSIEGDEPHMLLGPRGGVASICVDPLGRWFATEADHAIYLWEFPKGKRLHLLDHEEFLETIRSLTTFRAIENPKAASGYRLQLATFAGWDTLPDW